MPRTNPVRGPTNFDSPASTFDFPESVARAFTELDGDIHFLSAAVQRYVHGIAGTVMVQHEVHVELVCNLLAVDRHDDIAADAKAAHTRLYDAVAPMNACYSG